MLKNVIDPIVEATNGKIQTVVIHGTKAYGVHLPPPHITKIPGKESQPRVEHPNFYWQQEDYIRDLAAKYAGFSYTFLRPPAIINSVHGAAMSVLAAFGVFASICKEQNQPLGFPGSKCRNVSQIVDVNLLAKMIGWSKNSFQAKNETFNCTNGDVISWRELWHALAEKMGVEVGEDHPQMMSSFLRNNEKVWNDIVTKFQLKSLSLNELLTTSDQFADILWGPGETEPRPSDLVSDIKRFKAGFTEVEDSQEAVLKHLQKLIDQKIIPDLKVKS